MSLTDKIECVEVIQNWGYWRDQGRWAELASTFHEGGTISVTWFKGKFPDFIDEAKRSFSARKSLSKHHIGYPTISLSGDRAIAETNVSILGRQELDGVLVDSTAYARFLDRLERRDGAWRIQERAAIYEKDTLVPVVPSASFDTLMNSVDFSPFPPACRFLAFRLVRLGRSLVTPIYCDGMPETDALRISFSTWLQESG